MWTDWTPGGQRTVGDGAAVQHFLCRNLQFETGRRACSLLFVYGRVFLITFETVNRHSIEAALNDAGDSFARC